MKLFKVLIAWQALKTPSCNSGRVNFAESSLPVSGVREPAKTCTIQNHELLNKEHWFVFFFTNGDKNGIKI